MSDIIPIPHETWYGGLLYKVRKCHIIYYPITSKTGVWYVG